MEVHATVESISARVRGLRSRGKIVALVPTMGNLHAGHISLVEHAQSISDEVVVSIFVNPMQFGPNEDLDSYPRTLDADKDKLSAVATDHLFAPTVREMYPNHRNRDELQSRVLVPGLSEILCGATRPTHFSGVTTVVSMLFNIVQPDVAVFGQKDYQQLAIIRKMVDDLKFPLRIEGYPIVRESDGLALSSRNNYLTPQERQVAPEFNQILKQLALRISSGERDYTMLETHGKKRLEDLGFTPDYLTVCHADSLAPASREDKHLVILAAASLGKPRLLDNIELTLD